MATHKDFVIKKEENKNMETRIRVIGTFNPNKFRVAIFGSSRIKKNDPIYKQIYKLAETLGKNGIDIITGGGPGLMEAASSGHKIGSKKTKALSIGLGIKLPKEQKFNKNVDYKETFMRFTSRLDKFMLFSNAVVVAPGGVGTMLEFFYTWQLVQVKHVCNIPIIFLGDMWRGLLHWLKENPLKKRYFEVNDYKLLFAAKDYKDAMKIIEKSYDTFKKGGKDFCLNYDEYKVRL